MAIDYAALINRDFPVVDHHYIERDTMFYALSIGIGQDPLDERQLRFVYEAGLLAFPTMAAVIASPGFWAQDPDTGIDWKHILHAEQTIEFLRPLPVAGKRAGPVSLPGSGSAVAGVLRASRLGPP